MPIGSVFLILRSTRFEITVSMCQPQQEVLLGSSVDVLRVSVEIGMNDVSKVVTVFVDMLHLSMRLRCGSQTVKPAGCESALCVVDFPRSAIQISSHSK